MMSDNDIRKGFQSKLNGFEAPLPPRGWEELEQSLSRVAKNRLQLRRRWYAGSVAAVLVILLGSIWFLWNPTDDAGVMLTETESTVPLKGSSPDPESDFASATDSIPTPIEHTTESRKALVAENNEAVHPLKSQHIRRVSPGEVLTAWMERKKLKFREREEEIDAVELQQLAELIKKDTKQNEAESRTKDVIVIGGESRPIISDETLPRKDKRPLLLAINGKGGLTGYQQKVNSPVTLRSVEASNEDKYLMDVNSIQAKSGSNTGNISEMEHNQPVSFGITVAKYLSDDFSLETGLIYSYLYSKTRNSNNNFKEEEKQIMHYLGIPLNVNYNILSFNRFDVYASVGGMIEKDIYGKYRKLKEGQSVDSENVSNESEEMESVKISQKHPQFSVNVGVGFSYPIYDQLKLYGKIGGAYYFDAKNKYKTIYSDRKIVLDLNVGLRYEF